MKDYLLPYIYELYPIITAILSMLAAQFIKAAVDFYKTKKVTVKNIFTSGGMPSSHSALVIGLTTAIGLREGWTSAAFSISAVFSMVVMYDAAGVRHAAGMQASLLNKLVSRFEIKPADLEPDSQKSGPPLPKPEYNPLELEHVSEYAGHTPLEVFLGSILGAGMAFLLYF
ncbi:divergent PAP2 family protein [Thermoproteota archaeon]